VVNELEQEQEPEQNAEVKAEPAKSTRKTKQATEPTETVDTETGEITQAQEELVQADSSQEEWGEFE
jgi:hypothetical protein